MSIPARLHVILAREGSRAVVFRRGPSDKVAVIGWERKNDTFTPGQWLRGRIYPYRCDLSPKGEYLIYFAAKYGRGNPVEKRIEEELLKRFHVQETWEIDWESRQRAAAEIEETCKAEFARLRRSPDYHDRSWTAISRAPYLKALSLWWNGTGWNGGGLFASSREFYLNRPPEHIALTVPGVQSKKFRELPPSKNLREFGWGAIHGECPMVCMPRLERDDWRLMSNEEWGAVYHKELPGGWKLKKVFTVNARCDEPGKSVYRELHKLFGPSGEEAAVDTADWEWADFDAYRRRPVYASGGALYELDLKTLGSKLLYDFNGMKYERTPAPY